MEYIRKQRTQRGRLTLGAYLSYVALGEIYHARLKRGQNRTEFSYSLRAYSIFMYSFARNK
jgi:hypothetical protein